MLLQSEPIETKDAFDAIKWLSQAGPDKSSPDYGLRFFTVDPGGNIPIHKHFYVHTMYMLSGCLLVVSHDPESDEKISERMMGLDSLISLTRQSIF